MRNLVDPPYGFGIDPPFTIDLPYTINPPYGDRY